MNEQMLTQLRLVLVGLLAELAFVAQACMDAPKMLVQSAHIPERGCAHTTNVWPLAGVDFQVSSFIARPYEALRAEITAERS
jgi:hypothetical protein